MHILTPVSAEATSAQRHAHHYSFCGAARHTQACLHTRMRTCTHIETQTCKSIHTGAHTNLHMHAHKHRHMREHTCTYTRTNTQAHTRAHTHSHAHMHMHAHVARMMGCANFFSVASDAPTLVPLKICQIHAHTDTHTDSHDHAITHACHSPKLLPLHDDSACPFLLPCWGGPSTKLGCHGTAETHQVVSRLL